MLVALINGTAGALATVGIVEFNTAITNLTHFTLATIMKNLILRRLNK
jgi:hypothetical protein